MNELIETLFNNFTVDGERIPVSLLYYEGKGETYITYQLVDESDSYSGDDKMLGYVEWYDFDIYSKSDYTNIVKAVKKLLCDNDFTYSTERSSGDMYERDTGYYHRTLCFKTLKGENTNG